MTDATYFDALYASARDPWHYETSPYEHAKYRATLDAILEGRGPRVGRALEVGCSIGVFSRELAGHCTHVTAVDFSENALAQARILQPDTITFLRMAIPKSWPEGCFETIVLSEVLYYLTPAEIAATAELCAGSLAPSGRVIAVNWLGDTGTALSGDAAADLFTASAAARLSCRRTERFPRYRLDTLTR